MIIGLLISATAVAIALWLTLLFMWWQKEQQKTEPLAAETALSTIEKGIRLARRGWYASMMCLKSVGIWGSKKMQKVFFSLFPSAVPAFAKRDALAGLQSGPSSFFLMSISEKAKLPKKSSKKAFS